MQKIKKLGERFFFYNIDVVLMYISLSLIFLHRATGFNINIWEAFFIFLANALGVTGIYLLNKITDHEEDFLNGHKVKNYNNKIIYVLLSLLFLTATSLYFVSVKENILIYGLILFTFGTLYSFPKRYRLKKIFLMKNFIPAFCWFFSLSVLIFASTDNLSIINIMKMMIPLFILEFFFEIIWDLPDRKGDKLAGVQTLPVVLGFEYTQAFLAVLISSYFFYTDSIPNKLFCLFILVFIFLVKQETKKYIYHYFLLILTLAVNIIYFSKFF